MDNIYINLDNWIRKQKFTYNLGEWYKAKATKGINLDALYKLLPAIITDNNLKPQIVKTLELIAKAQVEDSDNEDEDDDSEKMHSFDRAYEKLLLDGWSEADEIVYEGLRYTTNNNDRMILAKTGNGEEYKIVGRDAKDLTKALSGLKVSNNSNINRTAYINDSIVRPILKICYGNWALSGQQLLEANLAGSVADVLYTTNNIYGEGDSKKDVVGFKLGYCGGKPTVERYIEKSLEAFFSRPEKYISDLAPISNDANEATLRYIPLHLKKGDWSAYQKWFNDTFDNVADNQNVIMQKIAGMLDAGNRSKQTLYIRGPGNDGKSTVFNAIRKYMGAASNNIDITLFEGAHGFSQLVGNRMPLIDDSRHTRLIGKTWYHSATGYGGMVINDKFEKPYTIQSISQFVQIENMPPIVNLHEDNQVSRMIYIKCKDKTTEEKIKAGMGVKDAEGKYQATGDTEFEKQINEQVEAFLAACLELYLDPKTTICPKRAQFIIPSVISDNLYTDCSDTKDDALENILKSNYITDPHGFVSKQDIYKLVKHYIQKDWNELNTASTINTMLLKYFGAKEFRKREGDLRIRGYIGLKSKTGYGITSSFQSVDPTDAELEELSNYGSSKK